ncbi:hypothetical protein ANRL1_04352 [Anaerolineae bacterium]|nr:hypothetical protein ANRL1_04352 [Anaerolineae bacterium]
MKPQVCIDASFGIKIVLIENDSERVEQLREQWIQTETRIFAPPLFLYESVERLYNTVKQRLAWVKWIGDTTALQPLNR